MSSRCGMELCPYWDGHTCPCERFGIDPPGPGTDPFSLPSATYVGDEYDGDEEPLRCELDRVPDGVCLKPLVNGRCPVHGAGIEHGGSEIRQDDVGSGPPVVEQVTTIVPIGHADGTVSLSRIDGTIIGPRSIARPEAVAARALLDERDGGDRRG